MKYNFMEDDYYRAKENKMTREEAEKKFDNAFDGAYGRGYAAQQVAGFEALGLIKFEEKKSAKDVVTEARVKCLSYEDFIKNLESNGYKIVLK